VRPARYSSRRELRRLAEFAQELLRILQIAGVEALCEPTVPKREQLAGFGPSACSPKAALGSSQAQFEGLCLPLARLVKALARMRLKRPMHSLHEEPRPEHLRRRLIDHSRSARDPPKRPAQRSTRRRAPLPAAAARPSGSRVFDRRYNPRASLTAEFLG
jgi:hypothetical protein